MTWKPADQIAFEAKMQAQSNYVEFIHGIAIEDPVKGAQMLAEGLMRGDPEELRLGYGLGSALISALEHMERWGTPLTTNQIGALVDRIATPKEGIVEYGPTKLLR